MNTVFIEWWHGSADKRITEEYKIENLDLFLEFLCDLRGVSSSDDMWAGISFVDEHHTRTLEHINKVNAKYDHQFEECVPSDIRFSNYRPAVNNVWVKVGRNIKYIIWGNLLPKGRQLTLPKIGDTIELDSCKLHGNLKYNGKTITTTENINANPQLIDSISETPCKYTKLVYHKFNATVIDVFIKKHSNKEFTDNRPEFVAFQYYIVSEYKGSIFISSKIGYDSSIPLPTGDKLYYFNK